MAEKNNRQKIHWTDKMIHDLLACKTTAKTINQSPDCPKSSNGRKRGYMALMLEEWEKLGYGDLNLTAQNLRDRAGQEERNITSIVSTYEDVARETDIINLNNTVNTVNEIVTNNLEHVEDITSTDEREFVDNHKEIIESIKGMYNDIYPIEGDMSLRKFKTRLQKKPKQCDIDTIARLCVYLYNKLPNNGGNVKQLLWKLNCITYATIVTWLQSNGIKLQEKENKTNTANSRNDKPRWMQRLENEITETRKVLSRCVNERERLKIGGRLTRKLKRNRIQIAEKCGTISIVNLTKLIEKLKASLRNIAKKKRKKIKTKQTQKLNEIFIKSPKDIYKHFSEIIAKNEESETPKFEEKVEKERIFFTDATEVESFWKNLWNSPDKGNPNAEWLLEIEKLFIKKVPNIDEGNVIITDTDVHNAIKKKRNWSSAGPDGIVNFWWKYLKRVQPITRDIFERMLNNPQNTPKWYCGGRTSLLEKEGEWSAQNQRPITCLNTHYKWLTSTLLAQMNEHLKKNNMMQVDQRGAKENSCGTSDNLMIDDMILRDAQYAKKNLSCAWLDVKKAYDSVSHGWVKRMLELHRFPRKITMLLITIMYNWNLKLLIPIENGIHVTNEIDVTNGILQGDSLSGNLYCLSKNPISWHIRRSEGYILSPPIKQKVTHSLYIDDAKLYTKNNKKLEIALDDIEVKMSHAGLLWNEKKCKVIQLLKGVPNTENGDVTLKSGKIIKCLKDTENYRFLGVPEAERHDSSSIIKDMTKKVKQRAHVIWTSPLYDINKVEATNTYVNSILNYYMWSEKFKLNDLRQIDREIRKTLNLCGAKHPLQLNELLYVSRHKGGRGLRCVENTYKETKVKSAIKLVMNTDPQIKLVKEFYLQCQTKHRSSLFTDAIKYGNELGIKVEVEDSSVTLKTVEEEIKCVLPKDMEKAKKLLKKQRNKKMIEIVDQSTWQGLTIKARENDETLVKGYFNWATKWKTCPTHVIREIYDTYYQLIPTKVYKKTRTNTEITNVKCRYCFIKDETISHLLSSCSCLAKSDYLRRHNKALDCFIHHVLFQYGLITKLPPWFTKITVQPYYNNKKVTIWYDIPEYTNNEEETEERRAQRPDGKILLKEEKVIYVVEMSVPWINNRESKYREKVQKYDRIRRNLKINYPEYKIDQITLIMDVMGGYSKELEQNIDKIIKGNVEKEQVICKMQKAITSELSYFAKKFKATADII